MARLGLLLNHSSQIIDLFLNEHTVIILKGRLLYFNIQLCVVFYF